MNEYTVEFVLQGTFFDSIHRVRTTQPSWKSAMEWAKNGAIIGSDIEGVPVRVLTVRRVR